jgi:hypothetical protein
MIIGEGNLGICSRHALDCMGNPIVQKVYCVFAVVTGVGSDTAMVIDL